MNVLKFKSSLFLLFIAGLFLFYSCGVDESQDKDAGFDLNDPQKKDEVILQIGDSIFSNSDFASYVLATLGEDQQALTAVSLSRLFDNFVEEKIFLQAAKNHNMFLTAEEKSKYLEKFSEEVGPDEEAALDELDTEILFDRLLIDKYKYGLVKDIEVEEEEIKDYYKYNKRDFLRSERLKVSQILLESEDMAIEIYERVKSASEEDFRKIAKDESVGLEAFKGGEMGVFEMGQLPYELEKVIFSLKEGEISPVVESAYGYHIFRLDKRFELELISEEEAESIIRRKVLNLKVQERLSNHLEELKRDTNWIFYPMHLSFPYQRNDS